MSDVMSHVTHQKIQNPHPFFFDGYQNPHLVHTKNMLMISTEIHINLVGTRQSMLCA